MCPCLDRHVEDIFGSINSICNNNTYDTLYLRCSINTTFDSKLFSFCSQYIHCMINSFCNNFVSSLDIQDQGNSIVFDAYIRYNEYNILVIGKNVLKIFLISNFSINIFSIKGKMIRKSVYKTKPGEISLFRL